MSNARVTSTFESLPREDAGLHLEPCSSHVLCPCRWLRRMIQFKEKSASQVNLLHCALADTSCLAEALTAPLAPPPGCFGAPKSMLRCHACACKIIGVSELRVSVCVCVHGSRQATGSWQLKHALLAPHMHGWSAGSRRGRCRSTDISSPHGS